jgi:hypothetical protein
MPSTGVQRETVGHRPDELQQGAYADTGQALGPIIIGVLLAKIGYLPAFSLLSVFLLAWTGMFVQTGRRA